MIIFLERFFHQYAKYLDCSIFVVGDTRPILVISDIIYKDILKGTTWLLPLNFHQCQAYYRRFAIFRFLKTFGTDQGYHRFWSAWNGCVHLGPLGWSKDHNKGTSCLYKMWVPDIFYPWWYNKQCIQSVQVAVFGVRRSSSYLHWNVKGVQSATVARTLY